MTNNIKCLIVDDEPLAIDVIDNYLKRLPNIESFKCNNAINAFQILQQEKIALIFLDIEMPLMSGLDFLKTMKTPPAVVITTAYRDYAVEGYEHDALDYLVKPISFPRFMKAFEKVLKHLQTNHPPAEGSESKRTSVSESEWKMVKIAIAEILYVESLKIILK
jgi:DNA-binding LytR/AlgR family response regulator